MTREIVMVVAQRPFRINTNEFCKTLPVLSDSGEKLSPSDFPNDGEIWWMLTPQTKGLAIPGRLILGQTETAIGFKPDDPYNSSIQIVRDSPRNLYLKDGLEILEIAPDALTDIVDLVASGVRVKCDHVPVSNICLKWKNHIFGPFDVHEYVQDELIWRISLRAHNSDITIKKVPEDEFRYACKDHLHQFNAEVGMSDHLRYQQTLRTFRYIVLLGAGMEAFQRCSGETIDMEPLEQKLSRISKKLLTRSKRQQLTGLLNDLALTTEKAEDPDQLKFLLSRIGEIQKEQEDALNRVCDVLLQSGAFGHERIEDAKKRYFEEYITHHAAEMQAGIQSKIDNLQKQADRMEQELQNRRTAETAALQRDLQSYRDKVYSELNARELKVKQDEASLLQERDVLQKNLEDAALILSKSGEKVVSNFMTMIPLLQRTGLFQGGSRGGVTQTEPPAESIATVQFELPAYVTAARMIDKDLTEQEFFNRFKTVVENSGYQYDLLDLKRYHLSTKCSELTIIGGPSGIGKTSLALLYARALRGDDPEAARRDTLVVNVNPAWMEVRDILGHMNTLEQRYCPSETRLYEYLIYAHEEYQRHQDGSALYPICFDEMNLSQVEHYFSDFLQLVEMPMEARVLSCFNAGVAGKNCAFRNWAQLTLPPSLRFVGTVNFDETTRRLSDRLLDRCNLVMLSAGSLPSTLKGTNYLATCVGPRVTLGQYRQWIREAALPTDLAKILDACRKPLAGIGVPLSARAYRGICRFVASANDILSFGEAFDVQLAQRVLSKIRNLVTSAQYDALDQLGEVLRQSTVCGFDISQSLLADVREREQRANWQMGD